MSLFTPIQTTDPIMGLTELKQFLKIEDDTDDKLLKKQILAATSAVERVINQTIMENTFEHTFYANYSGSYTLQVSQAPLRAVRVAGVDSLGNPFTPRFNAYTQAREITVSGIVAGSSVTIEADVGMYADPDFVDPLLTQAIMLLVSYWYEARDASDIPASVLSLTRPFKLYGL